MLHVRTNKVVDGWSHDNTQSALISERELTCGVGAGRPQAGWYTRSLQRPRSAIDCKRRRSFEYVEAWRCGGRVLPSPSPSPLPTRARTAGARLCVGHALWAARPRHIGRESASGTGLRALVGSRGRAQALLARSGSPTSALTHALDDALRHASMRPLSCPARLQPIHENKSEGRVVVDIEPGGQPWACREGSLGPNSHTRGHKGCRLLVAGGAATNRSGLWLARPPKQSRHCVGCASAARN